MATFIFYRQGPTVFYWGAADLTVDALLPYYEIEAGCTNLAVDATLPAYIADTDYNRFVMTIAQVDAYLPAFTCEGQFGERATLDERLPGIELTEMRAGARLDEKLPDLRSDSTMLVGRVAILDKKLPEMVLKAHFGARADDLKLPDYEIDISITGDRLLRLDKILPGFEIEAAGSTPYLMTLDKKLPVFRPTIAISFDTTGSVDGIIPPFKIDASMLCGQLLTLNELLPALGIVASGYSGDMTVDANLPTLVMMPLGTGGSVLPISILIDTTRFTDYVLRYER